MKKVIWFIFLFVIPSLPFLSSADASRAIRIKSIEDLSHKSGKLGAYKALIIAINDYHDPEIPDLDTPLNDARAVGDLLRERYGFKVEHLLDRKATKEAMYKSLRKHDVI